MRPRFTEALVVFLACLLVDWALKRALVDWWISREVDGCEAELAGYLEAHRRE